MRFEAVFVLKVKNKISEFKWKNHQIVSFLKKFLKVTV